MTLKFQLLYFKGNHQENEKKTYRIMLITLLHSLKYQSSVSCSPRKHRDKYSPRSPKMKLLEYIQYLFLFLLDYDWLKMYLMLTFYHPRKIILTSFSLTHKIFTWKAQYQLSQFGIIYAESISLSPFFFFFFCSSWNSLLYFLLS
jgi:hypothetical protein